MSEEHIVRYTRRTMPPSRIDWAKVDALTDEEITRAIAKDPDAAPLLDEEWFRNAMLVTPRRVGRYRDGRVLHWVLTRHGAGLRSLGARRHRPVDPDRDAAE